LRTCQYECHSGALGEQRIQTMPPLPPVTAGRSAATAAR
jgi:hypothetical protein